MSESDPFAFLEGNEAEPVTNEPEAQAAAPEAQEPEPQPEPEAQAQPEPVQEQPQQREEPEMVPVSALKAERQKRQELERLLAQQPANQEALAPPVYQDPYAYTEAVAQQLAQKLEQQRYQISQMNAASRYGAEEVERAREWALERFNSDPFFEAKVSQSHDPYSVVVEDYRRERVLAQLKPDQLQEFLAWKAAQSGGQQPAPAVAPAAASTRPAMTSLKTVAMAGGVKPTVKAAPVSEQEVFDQMFS